MTFADRAPVESSQLERRIGVRHLGDDPLDRRIRIRRLPQRCVLAVLALLRG
jgi:hypothetical protein